MWRSARTLPRRTHMLIPMTNFSLSARFLGGLGQETTKEPLRASRNGGTGLGVTDRQFEDDRFSTPTRAVFGQLLGLDLQGLTSFKVGNSRPQTMSDSGTTSGATDLPSWPVTADLPTSQTPWPTPWYRSRTRTRWCTTTIGAAGAQKPRRSPPTRTSGLPTIWTSCETISATSGWAYSPTPWAASLDSTTAYATLRRAPAWSWSALRPRATQARSLYRHCVPSVRLVRPRLLPWLRGTSPLGLGALNRKTSTLADTPRWPSLKRGYPLSAAKCKPPWQDCPFQMTTYRN